MLTCVFARKKTCEYACLPSCLVYTLVCESVWADSRCMREFKMSCATICYMGDCLHLFVPGHLSPILSMPDAILSLDDICQCDSKANKCKLHRRATYGITKNDERVSCWLVTEVCVWMHLAPFFHNTGNSSDFTQCFNRFMALTHSAQPCSCMATACVYTYTPDLWMPMSSTALSWFIMAAADLTVYRTILWK